MLKLDHALKDTGRKLLANSKSEDSEIDGVDTMLPVSQEHAPCLQHSRVGQGTGTFLHPC